VSSKTLKVIGLGLLGISMVLVYALRNGVRNPEEIGSDDSGSPISKRPSTGESDGSYTVNTIGIGDIQKVARVEDFRPLDLYERYGLENTFSASEPLIESESAKIYFNDKNEIVKMTFRSGTYKTISREEQIVARFEKRFGFRIIKNGVTGLTLGNEDKMRQFLKLVPFSAWNDEKEFEVTPIVIEKTRADKKEAEFFNKIEGERFEAVFVRNTEGLHSDLVNSDLPDYLPEEKVRWNWTLKAFPEDFKQVTGQSKYELLYSDHFDEPTVDAFEKKKFIRTKWLDEGASIEMFVDEREED
jgi:hypothetical protein